MAQLAQRLAERTLEGAGLVRTDVFERATYITTLRRQCSDVERRRVIEKFLKI